MSDDFEPIKLKNPIFPGILMTIFSIFFYFILFLFCKSANKIEDYVFAFIFTLFMFLFFTLSPLLSIEIGYEKTIFKWLFIKIKISNTMIKKVIVLPKNYKAVGKYIIGAGIYFVFKGNIFIPFFYLWNYKNYKVRVENVNRAVEFLKKEKAK